MHKKGKQTIVGHSNRDKIHRSRHDIIYLYIYSERCLRGNIRLVGGETDMEGRVEICGSNYGWGTVCNRQWTSSHTKVVCRNLGYDDTEGKLPM